MQVLHLAGSPTSEFYYNLSLLYAREVIKPDSVKSYYGVINPQGQWQLGENLDSLSPKMSLTQFISSLPSLDVVIPHLFCFLGMTSYRSFFEDILFIPVVGSTAKCTAIAANKAQTKAIVSNYGVRVAKGQLLRKEDETIILSLNPPFIVKPNIEDNSMGLTLVREKGGITTAIKKAFQFDTQILIEEFIDGRELRVAVIERKGELEFLPMIEYLVSDDNPIRTPEEKLDFSREGMPERQTAKPKIKAVYPAEVSPELTEEIAIAVKKAHLALGCRDYSLYDFRVKKDTNQPYLLEAGLFWSFSPISAISRMLTVNNNILEDVALELWQNYRKLS